MGQSNQNGVPEKAHDVLKTALEQALFVRGSRGIQQDQFGLEAVLLDCPNGAHGWQQQIAAGSLAAIESPSSPLAMRPGARSARTGRSADLEAVVDLVKRTVAATTEEGSAH